MPELLFLESTWNINDRSNGPIHPPTLYPPQKNPVGMSGLHRDTKIWLVEKGKAGRLSLNECSKIRVHRCPWTGLGHFQDTVVAKTGPPEGKEREPNDLPNYTLSYGLLLLLLLLNRCNLVRLCATKMEAHQAPRSLGFSRQEYWSVLPLPSPMHACMLSHFSHVRLCATLRTAAHQAPLSTGVSRQEYRSGLQFPSPHMAY